MLSAEQSTESLHLEAGYKRTRGTVAVTHRVGQVLVGVFLAPGKVPPVGVHTLTASLVAQTMP